MISGGEIKNESNFTGRCKIPWEKREIVNVSDGYARNMILPKKLGIEANPKNLNDLKLQKANEEKVAQENLSCTGICKEILKTKEVILTLKDRRGRKNIWLCIFKRNLRSSQRNS